MITYIYLGPLLSWAPFILGTFDNYHHGYESKMIWTSLNFLIVFKISSFAMVCKIMNPWLCVRNEMSVKKAESSTIIQYQFLVLFQKVWHRFLPLPLPLYHKVSLFWSIPSPLGESHTFVWFLTTKRALARW